MSGGDAVIALLSSCRRRLGACDRAALRAALSVGDALDLPVVAVAATAEPESERALRVAARAGCARLIAVEADPDELDYLALARVLVGAVAKTGPRLVVCGDQSEASRRGAVGPAVAELLGLPHLSGVTAVVADAGGEIRCRATFDAETAWFAASSPILLCVRAHDEPAADRSAPASRARIERYRPSRGGDVASAETLDLEPRQLSGERVAVGPRGGAAIAETAADLVRRLRDDHLI